jgi:tetratricopeptide (TPR) repeat protein
MQQENTLVANHRAEIAALQAEHRKVLEGLQGELAAARSSQGQDMVALRSDLATREAAHKRELVQQENTLVANHRAEIAALQAEHKKALEALQGEFAAFRTGTVRDREDTARFRGEIARLEAALEAAQTANERERFLLAYNSGSLFLAAGRHDRAEQEFLKALAIREDDAPLHYNMGILYDSHLRQPAKARVHYERFLELAPNDRDAPLVMQWLRELR